MTAWQVNYQLHACWPAVLRVPRWMDVLARRLALEAWRLFIPPPTHPLATPAGVLEAEKIPFTPAVSGMFVWVDLR